MNYAKIQPKHTLRGLFMEFQTLIESRRSVRKYSSHTNVTKEQIQQLVQAALEAPSWKNTETGRYYCVLSEDMSQKLRKECLCYANNDVKTEHAALIVTTFVHNRAGFQTDGTPDNEIGNGWGCYDLGLQNENLILKATDLGLSTLIMGLRDGDKIREMLLFRKVKPLFPLLLWEKLMRNQADRGVESWRMF